MAVPKNIVLPAQRSLDDGSYLPEIAASDNRDRRDPARDRDVEYRLDDRDEDTVYRLVTTICDPGQAPAVELAALYHQRWETENTLNEIKTHQSGRQLALRPQHPDGIEQEIHGFLLVHHALRDITHHTACQAGPDPDRISFTRTLNATRRHVTAQAALPPQSSLAADTPITDLVRLAKVCWRIEHDYRELKHVLGLNHFEGRSWPGWHHHITLVTTHAFLTEQRLAPKAPTPGSLFIRPSRPPRRPEVLGRHLHHLPTAAAQQATHDIKIEKLPARPFIFSSAVALFTIQYRLLAGVAS